MAQIRLLHSKPTTCSSYPSLLQLRPQGTAPFVNCIVPHRLSATTCSRSSPSSFPRTRGDLGTNWSLNCFCHHRAHLPLSLPCCTLDFTATNPRTSRQGYRYLLPYKKSSDLQEALQQVLLLNAIFCAHASLISFSAILDTGSSVPWTPRLLRRVRVLSGSAPFPSTPVLQAWLSAVHRSMVPAAACACYRLASRGCAFHFREPSACTVRYILQLALRSFARPILS